MKRKLEPGKKQIYENVFDGISYYPEPGGAYHLNRSKKKVQKHYLESVASIANPAVPDIECGIGTDPFMLLKPHKRIKLWGVDVSKDAIKYARTLAKKRGEKNISFTVADANSPLPLNDNCFDVVVALELIKRLQNPAALLREVRRLLKPNGTAIISTPNEKSFRDKLVACLPVFVKSRMLSGRIKDFSRHGPAFHLNPGTWDNDAHVSLKTWPEWKNLFYQTGFRVESVDDSAIYGGSRIVADHPFLLGLVILSDSIIDKLPLKPHLQMCLMGKLKKSD